MRPHRPLPLHSLAIRDAVFLPRSHLIPLAIVSCGPVSTPRASLILYSQNFHRSYLGAYPPPRHSLAATSRDRYTYIYTRVDDASGARDGRRAAVALPAVRIPAVGAAGGVFRGGVFLHGGAAHGAAVPDAHVVFPAVRVECIGFVSRALLVNDGVSGWHVGLDVGQTLLLLLAPTLFAGSLYMVHTRIVRLTGGEAHSAVPVRWLTKLGTFMLFVVHGLVFYVRMGRRPTMGSETANTSWRRHLRLVVVASGLILARDGFRLAEYLLGPGGVLRQREIFTILLDSVLMFLCMLLFNLFHPSTALAEQAEHPAEIPVLGERGVEKEPFVI
ncbi:hypothetical protein PtA15_10A451 [Puccinia triticina]|uniref:Uncharacterized protein n=1 Tax=Puccinia triticina TaxID=208348 RepID=A0ABY7CVT1_9BASI|nr:uncharacterized protein PtA15_10A451 [Puccinia triticina]WAQ89028.1 hypothetical protein PtA15_10A451 [Puccinia triticina]